MILAPALLGLSTLTSPPQDLEPVQYTFQVEPISAVGHADLEDFFQDPIVVHYSSTEGPEIEQMRRLAEKYEEEVAFIFVDLSALSHDELERSLFDHRWMCGPEMWTKEVPIPFGDVDPPHTVLLDADHAIAKIGRIDGRELEKAVKKVLDDALAPPPDFPKSFRNGWKSLRKGQYVRAFKTKAKNHDELKAQYRLRSTVIKAQLIQTGRVRRLLEQGRLAEAEELARNLQKLARTIHEGTPLLPERRLTRDPSLALPTPRSTVLSASPRAA